MNHPIIRPDRISLMVASNVYWQFYKERLGHPEWPDKLLYDFSTRYYKRLGTAVVSNSFSPSISRIVYSVRALSFPSVLNEVAAHEVAHIATNCHYKEHCGHDSRWQKIMAMTGITPRTIFDSNYGRYLECRCDNCLEKKYVNRRGAKTGKFICSCGAALDNKKFVEPREVIGV